MNNALALILLLDVQIRPREIIMPLQALARRDPAIARNLFTSIFNALYKQVPKNNAEQTKPELRVQFENVFKQTRHNTPFVGCLLKVSIVVFPYYCSITFESLDLSRSFVTFAFSKNYWRGCPQEFQLSHWHSFTGEDSQ